MHLTTSTLSKPLRAAVALAVLATAAVAAVAAPGAAAHGAFPAHAPGAVSCASNPVSGMPQIAVATPDLFLTSRAAGERVAARPVLYRWNGSVWAHHRTGTWAYATANNGQNPVGAPLPKLTYTDSNRTRLPVQTFSPLEGGHYAVLIQFWWSSTRAIHNMWAVKLSGARVNGTYCTL